MGPGHFTIKAGVVEQPEDYFNPFLALITAASRLVLGITEALLDPPRRHLRRICDTDGIGIPPEHVAGVRITSKIFALLFPG